VRSFDVGVADLRIPPTTSAPADDDRARLPR
jgi:hypothetical protein